MAAEPVFAVTPRIGAIKIATADTAYATGSGNNPTNFGGAAVITGAANGTRIAEVVVKMAQTTTSAALVRLFLHDNATSTWYLWDEIAINAVSGAAANTASQLRISTTYSNLVLPDNNWSLRATTTIGQEAHVIALAADL